MFFYYSPPTAIELNHRDAEDTEKDKRGCRGVILATLQYSYLLP